VEGEVLIFVILHEKCKNSATLSLILILTLISIADWSDKSQFIKRMHSNDDLTADWSLPILLKPWCARSGHALIRQLANYHNKQMIGTKVIKITAGYIKHICWNFYNI